MHEELTRDEIIRAVPRVPQYEAVADAADLGQRTAKMAGLESYVSSKGGIANGSR